MDRKNVVLIGMPAAGKSTVGVLLAKSLKMPFIDTDLLIQQSENRLLQEIINLDGIEKFLDIEERVILELKADNCVIATGGSVIYRHAAMLHLKESGLIVNLKLKLNDIERRLRNITTRGIAMSSGQALPDIYNERIPLYEKYADLTINCTGKNLEEVVGELVLLLKMHAWGT